MNCERFIEGDWLKVNGGGVRVSECVSVGWRSSTGKQSSGNVTLANLNLHENTDPDLVQWWVCVTDTNGIVHDVLASPFEGGAYKDQITVEMQAEALRGDIVSAERIWK
jgi:hypothetical protein